MTPSQNDSGKTSQELSELSDMIRRHAEELARLSGSLQGQSEPPPKPSTAPFEPSNTPPPQQNPLGDASSRSAASSPTPMTWNRLASDQGLPVLANDLAVNAESLPVLNAFRLFIEEERKQTRRRMIRLSVFTILGVIIVVGIAAFAVFQTISRTRRQVDDVQVQNVKAQREHQVRFQAMATSNSNIEKRLQRDRLSLLAVASVASNVQMTLQSDHRNLALVRSDMAMKLSGQSQELDKLKETIASLEIENALLSGSLKELMAVREQPVPPESTDSEKANDETLPALPENSPVDAAANEAPEVDKEKSGAMPQGNNAVPAVKTTPLRLPDL